MYREDFEGWTKETFLKGDKHLVRIFRDYLRSWGVYIPKNSDSISQSLAETFHEERPAIWLQEALEAQAT
jgi:hypothetical protein